MVIKQHILVVLEIKKFIVNKSIMKNIQRIQAYDSMISGKCCIGFIDFMMTGMNLLDYTNLFCSNKDIKNDKLILE